MIGRPLLGTHPVARHVFTHAVQGLCVDVVVALVAMAGGSYRMTDEQDDAGVARVGPIGPLMFTKHVAPILYRHCQTV